LLDAGVSVSDAAYACCFSDQSHLTRVFKRTLGMPPGQYLRASR
jgi:AraC family transcriptional regulator